MKETLEAAKIAIEESLIKHSQRIAELEKQKAELSEALEECLPDVVARCTDLGLDCTKYSTYQKAKQAIKDAE